MNGKQLLSVILVIIFIESSGFYSCRRLISQEKKKEERLAPYLATPENIVYEILKLADVKKEDVVYDLGCGDARILVAAAKEYSARCVGIEIAPDIVEKARKNVQDNGVEKLVTIIQGDLMTTDFSDATVVTLFIGSTANELLKPKLEEQLKPGTRVVSHDFDIPGWKPEKVKSFYKKTKKENPFYDKVEDHRLYLWIMGKHK